MTRVEGQVARQTLFSRNSGGRAYPKRSTKRAYRWPCLCGIRPLRHPWTPTPKLPLEQGFGCMYVCDQVITTTTTTTTTRGQQSKTLSLQRYLYKDINMETKLTLTEEGA